MSLKKQIELVPLLIKNHVYNSTYRSINNESLDLKASL